MLMSIHGEAFYFGKVKKMTIISNTRHVCLNVNLDHTFQTRKQHADWK